MRAWTACLAVLSACGFTTPGLSDGGDAPPVGSTCYGTVLPICFTVVPESPVTFASFTSTIVDTESPERCDQNNDKKDAYCVIASTNLTLPASSVLRGQGTKPLVLLSTSSIQIEIGAVVDVSSNSVLRGAGADPEGPCGNTASTDDFSGGFGGSFGGRGGTGEGIGGSDREAVDPLTAPPAVLRGGCRGATGGSTPSGGLAGVGGSGGGAVAFIAAQIRLDGTINASGAGGRGGGLTVRAGGGGGGSGGLILLDAASIVRGDSGALFANGGGGGQGAAGPTGSIGPGEDGRTSIGPAAQGLGGINASRDGGSGGNGSTGSTRLDGLEGGNAPAIRDGGGGGGGGGAGFIRIRDANGSTVISGDTVISPPAWVPR